MGIRWRLLILAIVIAVPLALIGVADLRGMWGVSRSQLDNSVKQQAELAAIAFERWVDAERQPLTTIAANASERIGREPSTRLTMPADYLRSLVETHPYWIDARIVDASGNSLMAEPTGKEPPTASLISHLLSEIERRDSWAVVTDRTGDEASPVFAIAVPLKGGGAVVARVSGEAVGELFRNIELSDQAIIAVFDEQGRILYRSQTLERSVDLEASSSPLFAALGSQRAAFLELESPYDGIRRVYGLSRTRASNSIVVVGIPSVTLYEPARRQLMWYITFSILALFAAICAALVTERSIVLPIKRLRQAAQVFGAGNLKARAPLEGSREISELGAAFNSMAEQIAEREERLAELDRLKSEFVSGVSHELRTPLTTIKTLTHVLLRGEETATERREYLETIAAECDRQIDLVLNLLDLSRIESGAYRLNLSKVNPAEVIAACIELERHAAEARGQNIRADLPAELPPVTADKSALRRVICSLLENAIKYSPQGGEIIVRARAAAGEEMAIEVRDEGCGIFQEDLPHVFEKFYRGRPASETMNNPQSGSLPCPEPPGVGLGLYLVRSIIEQLGGRIVVESGAGRSTVFTLYLPLWREKTQADTTMEDVNVQATAHS